MKFSVVVPTYNRPKDLSNLLNSVLKQGLLPDEILIVDDGDLEGEYIKNYKIEFEKKDILFNYYKKDHKKERRGLSESKNIALNIVSYDIVFFFDDDIIVDDINYFVRMMKIWDENKNNKLIGVGGLIKGNRKKSKFEKFYNNIFGLNSKTFNWDITDVGFQVWDESIENNELGYYAHGGASSFDKKKSKEILFSAFDGGRTGLEDVDFCLKAKNKGYHFILSPKNKVIHNHVKISRENEFLIGKKESKNRRKIFRNNCRQTLINKILFIWAMTGWTFRAFLIGNFQKFFGMIIGGFARRDN